MARTGGSGMSEVVVPLCASNESNDDYHAESFVHATSVAFVCLVPGIVAFTVHGETGGRRRDAHLSKLWQ